ncbi:MAG: hypothetical protein ACLR7U_07105 [Ruthenibacterium lactatiformans]
MSEGQTVKVKVMSISPVEQIALPSSALSAPRAFSARIPAAPGSPALSRSQGEMSFEDMMSQFKSRSEEKISDLRRVTEARRGGGYSRRGH